MLAVMADFVPPRGGRPASLERIAAIKINHDVTSH